MNAVGVGGRVDGGCTEGGWDGVLQGMAPLMSCFVWWCLAQRGVWAQQGREVWAQRERETRQCEMKDALGGKVAK